MAVKPSISAWTATLRAEYLEAKRSKDAGALRKLASRYLGAFSTSSLESRKTREFFELQVDEARVTMYVVCQANTFAHRLMSPCGISHAV
jgi:hypothetical protein